MDANTIFQISYEKLKNLMNEIQEDALWAGDMRGCDIELDIDEEIEIAVEKGDIKIVR